MIKEGWKNSTQTNKQTDRQTDKPTDTTKIMVTWPWTNIVTKLNRKANMNSYVLYRMMLFLTTLSYPNYGRRDFSVAGPTVWNSLPDFIRNPTISADCLDVSVCSILVHSAHRGSWRVLRYIKLLTYFTAKHPIFYILRRLSYPRNRWK